VWRFAYVPQHLSLPCLPAVVPWLTRLQAIALDPRESSRGLLAYFSSTQMDLIESLFVTMGDPILRLQYQSSLGSSFTDVEEAWDLAAESRAVSPQPE